MKSILNLTLKRSNQLDLIEPDTLRGHLRITFKEDEQLHFIQLRTIENRNYNFPEGHYFIQWQYSPKFKTSLWEFVDIDDRTEIKFHPGTKAEHSEGCILLSPKALNTLHKILDSKQLYTIKVK